MYRTSLKYFQKSITGTQNSKRTQRPNPNTETRYIVLYFYIEIVISTIKFDIEYQFSAVEKYRHICNRIEFKLYIHVCGTDLFVWGGGLVSYCFQ